MSYDTVDSMDVQVRGSKEQLNALILGQDIKASIDLKTYKEPGTYEVPVQIELPAGCTLENSITVKVILEKKV